VDSIRKTALVAGILYLLTFVGSIVAALLNTASAVPKQVSAFTSSNTAARRTWPLGMASRVSDGSFWAGPSLLAAFDAQAGATSRGTVMAAKASVA
jgi:hypothetical protein